jgi:GNAT superfamily N-acetyltransferase
MIEILPLTPEMAGEAADLLFGDPPDYRRHFTGLPEEAGKIADVLGAARKDAYWMVRVAGDNAGIFMLRGMDAGYTAPAFGVYIGSLHAGKGLARLVLAYSMAWCRLNGLDELMLTVADDNFPAIRIYEQSGMVSGGERSAKGHRIYRKKLA